MLICKHDEPEERQPATALMPAQVPALQPTLSAAGDQAGDEAQWEAYLAELILHQYGECTEGCDWTDGALSSGGCRW